VSGKRAKEHHYIPKAILRHFLINDQQVWLSERMANGRFCEPKARNIDTVFVKKDYYTVLENGSLSDKVEKGFYGEIDDFWGKFIKSVSESFESGNIPIVDPEGDELIANVVYHMVRRNPEFRPLHSDADVGKDFLLKMIDATSAIDGAEGLRRKYQGELESRVRLLHYGRDIRVRSQLRQSPEIETELKRLKLRWVVSRGKHSFILPSNLPYRIGNGGQNGLSNPQFEMWMPITPKLAVALTRDIPRRLPLVYEIGRDHMRHINSFGLESSSLIVSHDKNLLNSLINPR
jgi:hypothetical protein